MNTELARHEPSALAQQQRCTTLRLYQFAGEFDALGDMLEESFGELTPEIEELMDGLNVALDDKIDGYCGLIQNFQRTADAAAVEAKRLS